MAIQQLFRESKVAGLMGWRASRSLVIGLSICFLIGLVPVVGLAGPKPVDSTVQAKGFAELANDSGKTKLLIAISNLFPNLFNHAVLYNIPVLDVLDQAGQFLSANPELAEQLKADTLLEFKVVVKDEVKVTQKSIDPRAMAELRSVLQQALYDAQNLQALVNSAESLPFAFRSQAAVTFLLQLVPSEAKAEMFRRPLTEQLHFLSSRLTEAQLVRFDFARFGVAGAMNVPQLVQALEKAAQLEDRIVKATAASLVAANGQEPDRAVADFAEGQFDLLYEKANLARIESFATNIGFKRLFRSWLEKAIPQFSDRYARQKSESVSTISGELRLEQMHPLVALFRGFLAGDCSTMYSALYALTGAERVFLIRNEENEVKGIVGTTVNEVNGKANLYVHTVTGPNLSAAMTELTLTILYQSKEAFGAKTMTVAAPEKLSGLINYVGPRDVVSRWSERGAAVTQVYSDSIVRSKVDKIHMSAEFDRADSNKNARLAQPVGKPLQLEIQASSRAPENFTHLHLNRTDALVFMLEQYITGQTATAERIKSLLGLKFDQKSLDLILNFDRLPVALHIERMQGWASGIGLNLQREMVYQRSYAFASGILRAPDAFEAAHLDASVSLVVQLLEVFEPTVTYVYGAGKNKIEHSHLSEIGQLINRHAQTLAQHPRFIEYFRRLFDADLCKVEKIDALVKAGIPLSVAADKMKQAVLRLIDMGSRSDSLSGAELAFHKSISALPSHAVLDQLALLLGEGLEADKATSLFNVAGSVPQIFAMKRLGLLYARTKDQALRLLSYGLRNGAEPSTDYIYLSMKIVIANQVKLRQLGVRASDLRMLGAEAPKIYAGAQALQKVDSAEDFLKVVQRLIVPTDIWGYVGFMTVLQAQERFYALKPTFEEGRALLRLMPNYSYFAEGQRALIFETLRIARQASDWVALSEDFKQRGPELGALWQMAFVKSLPRFLKSNPSLEQIESVFHGSIHIEQIKGRLLGVALKRMTEIEQLFKFVDFTRWSTNHYYGDGFNSFEAVMFRALFEEGTSLSRLIDSEEKAQLLEQKTFPYFVDALRIFRNAMAPTATAASLLRDLSWQNPELKHLSMAGLARFTARQEFAAGSRANTKWAMAQLALNLVNRFLELHPTKKELMDYRELNSDEALQALLAEKIKVLERSEKASKQTEHAEQTERPVSAGLSRSQVRTCEGVFGTRGMH
jgi:hypothetical protein